MLITIDANFKGFLTHVVANTERALYNNMFSIGHIEMSWLLFLNICINKLVVIHTDFHLYE